MDVQRFFKVYEREVGPLKASLRRYWQTQIESRHKTLEDLKRFLYKAEDEVAQLQMGWHRFMDMGSEEWETLKERVRYNFSHEFSSAFTHLPSPGDQGFIMGTAVSDIYVPDSELLPKTGVE